jgi:hypothetical protein
MGLNWEVFVRSYLRELDRIPAHTEKGSQYARQYEHIKQSAMDRGKTESEAKKIAAATVNRDRARDSSQEVVRKQKNPDRGRPGQDDTRK